MNAKLGSDGRLSLSGWLLDQLDSPGFAWRTKLDFLWGKDTKAGLVCQGDFIGLYLGTNFHFFMVDRQKQGSSKRVGFLGI